MDETVVASWVREAQDGGTRAVHALLREFRPRIFRFALARLGDESRADDVTQETCMAVVRALPTFEERGSRFSSFVFAIAANKITDLRRTEGRGPGAVEEDALLEVPDRAGGPEERAVRSDEVRRLAAPLAVLSERDRTILLLRIIGQLSAEEVAEAVGMSPGAVRVAQHRALKTLRNSIEEVTP